MKKLLSIFLAGLFFINAAKAQSTIPTLDKSPMDLATFPAGYGLLKLQGKATEPLAVRVIYSRPIKNNRVVFGKLVEYNKVWRFGANENTEI